MDQLITVINQLHDAFAEVKMNVKLNLPQIAVIGSQSSGKSSVLESIVGKDLLPRGSGIVTRCPLVLQLMQLPSDKKEEWGEFLHRPGKKYFDFTEINEEIANRTVEVAGPSAITDKTINLKVFSSKVLNLTLVDLPGLVMNAVGDQPKDIDRQIKDMVTKFVAPKNTIMLAISAANADLATSASLRLAKQLDPEGLRTVGVLTKLDLMDDGTDAADILEGKVLLLRHGFVGVVNRSQKDINESKGMDAAREAEDSFFRSHPSYMHMAERQGTTYLAKKLNILLLDHIKNVIPEIKGQVDSLIGETRARMEKLGMNEAAHMDPSSTLLSLIKVFSDTLNRTIDGGITEASKELLGGARLDYIFHESFASYINGLSTKKELTDDYIRINSRNMAGMHATIFPSDQVFVALAKQQISRLEDPSLKCVVFIYEELLKIVEICAGKLDRFPKLKRTVIGICQDALVEYRAPTTEHVRTLIAAERGFINVKHPMMEQLAQKAFLRMYGKGDGKSTSDDGKDEGKDGKESKDGKKSGSPKDGKDKGLIGGLADNNSMGNVPSNIRLGEGMSSYEQRIYTAIREMVGGYFSIVQGNVADQVPKAITLLLITKLREEVYARLVQKLYNGQKAEEVMAESPEVAAQRKSTYQLMMALNKAKTVLDTIRDYSLSAHS